VAVAAWGVLEVGMSVHDGVTTWRTIMDQCTSVSEKILTAGVFAAGLIAPGGGYVTAYKGARRGIRVIGHFPDYVNVAKSIPGAKYFSIPTALWNKLGSVKGWALNRKFLDRGIRLGDEFILATPIATMRKKSAYRDEIVYLLQHGYDFNWDYTKLIPTW
jgi:hypothetical protein